MTEATSPSGLGALMGKSGAWLLDLLACPDCRAPLGGAVATLVCSSCGREYAVTNGVPQLLPAALADGLPTDPAWRTWAGALDRLAAWRRQTWNGGVGATALRRTVHAIQAEFAAHCRLAEAWGTVLDIGCGGGGIAAVLPMDCQYVGVDPLPLPTPGGPLMVRAVGERLPLRAETIDWILILETLDHCQSPSATWAEVLRVLKPGGTLCLQQYVSPGGWGAWLVRWWRGSAILGRLAPMDSPKVTLLDAPDVLSLVRPAFAEMEVGRARQGSHLFVAARGKRDAGVRT